MLKNMFLLFVLKLKKLELLLIYRFDSVDIPSFGLISASGSMRIPSSLNSFKLWPDRSISCTFSSCLVKKIKMKQKITLKNNSNYWVKLPNHNKQLEVYGRELRYELDSERSEWYRYSTVSSAAGFFLSSAWAGNHRSLSPSRPAPLSIFSSETYQNQN